MPKPRGSRRRMPVQLRGRRLLMERSSGPCHRSRQGGRRDPVTGPTRAENSLNGAGGALRRPGFWRGGEGRRRRRRLTGRRTADAPPTSPRAAPPLLLIGLAGARRARSWRIFMRGGHPGAALHARRGGGALEKREALHVRPREVGLAVVTVRRRLPGGPLASKDADLRTRPAALRRQPATRPR